MEKCMNYDRALDFLLYSYFEFDGGIDGIQSGDDMKMCCAQRAYRDLARTVEYKYSTSMLENMNKINSTKKDKDEAKAFQDKKSKLINGVCSVIIEEIDKITEIKEQEAFDNWHMDMCNYIIGLMKAEKSGIYKGIIKDFSFTYGQAQKWLNMTLKYLWLFNLLPAGLDEKLLHVPVDSYIIDAVKAEPCDKIKYGLGLKCNVPSWSKWDEPDKYEKYQEKIRKEVQQKFKKSPIEWEAETWVKQSEIRKKNEKQAKLDTFFKENNPL